MGRPEGALRPEGGFWAYAGLGLFANLRPAIVHGALISASPLRPEILGGHLDIQIVRELTGGIYFGERGRIKKDGAEAAFDTELYTAPEIERIARVAFNSARKRSRRVCSVDKANVLESSRLWREMTGCTLSIPTSPEHMYVDNAAMQFVRNPPVRRGRDIQHVRRHPSDLAARSPVDRHAALGFDRQRHGPVRTGARFPPDTPEVRGQSAGRRSVSMMLTQFSA